MKRSTHALRLGTAVGALVLATGPLLASSHMDAPLITRDPSANTTDVYAFVDQDGSAKNLVVGLGVYPHQEPGVGPNKFNFDDTVLYQIHLALGRDAAIGRATLSYQFRFTTAYKSRNTILQSYVGVVEHVGDAAQNLTQTYSVTKYDHRTDTRTVLGTGIVPPNNEGKATPFYNQGDNGDNPAKGGVSSEEQLDRYTREAIADLGSGYAAFAGQRDDGFYADINSIFDLLSLRSAGKDSQGGFNIHFMALEIPVSELGGDRQIVGVYATTSRRRVTVLRQDDDNNGYGWAQVARQGNPLFNEGLVAIADKDLYSRTSPVVDPFVFRRYALNPELGTLINALILGGAHPEIGVNRTDIAGIFIPDVIKVDLSTGPARLTGTGGDDPSTGFSRLSVFGNDTLFSPLQNKLIPGGWPNGRRFGDDVVDIAIDAILAPLGAQAGDGVNNNDTNYSTVFPYESTPQNGRVHSHP